MLMSLELARSSPYFPRLVSDHSILLSHAWYKLFHLSYSHLLADTNEEEILRKLSLGEELFSTP